MAAAGHAYGMARAAPGITTDGVELYCCGCFAAIQSSRGKHRVEQRHTSRPLLVVFRGQLLLRH